MICFHKRAGKLAARGLVGGAVIIISGPDASGEIGAIADEPGVAIICCGAGFTSALRGLASWARLPVPVRMTAPACHSCHRHTAFDDAVGARFWGRKSLRHLSALTCLMIWGKAS